ncbi:MAG: DUF4321 domain-containing protein [Nitrospirae bacterium]|nr:DUF4321 domain-containing protein [Candidatus Troglogloeales bacterium]
MALLQRTPVVLFLFALGGALFGGLVGEALLFFSPTSLIKNTFLKSYQIGILPPATLDLVLITFTIGFTVRVNLLILLGILLGVYTYKQL